ncbi:hypothetical protein ACLOJK_007718 [Asimina triloba]
MTSVGRSLGHENAPRRRVSHKFPRRFCDQILFLPSGTLFEARSRAEEELEASLEWHYAEGVTEGERCFSYELQEMRQRANCAAALEAKAVDAAKTWLLQGLSEMRQVMVLKLPGKRCRGSRLTGVQLGLGRSG